MNCSIKFNPLGLVAIVGSAVMIFGIFMEWGTLCLGNSFVHSTFHFSGLDLMNDHDLIESVPNVDRPSKCILVTGIATILLSILPLVNKSTAGKIMSVASIGGSLSVFYITYRVLARVSEMDISFIVAIFRITGEVTLGPGIWVCTAGAVILLIGSVLNLIPFRKKETSKPGADQGSNTI